VAEIVPVRVAEIVPVFEVPVPVAEIVPTRVAEIVPALVAEMVPVLAKVVADRTVTNNAAQIMVFRFFISSLLEFKIQGYWVGLEFRPLSFLQADS
jgi:hypothetical protein